ncbi:MAG: SDR family NAD(P)-dependent oxidoreductase [Chloroflexi bacterium]|nr:SDR family NAD(P)-dependent oxidoreductase [Chloroflexota bacterium]
MSNYLRGKTAVVTGAGGGIGRAIAMALAAEGARVVVNDLGGDLHGVGSSSGMADGVVEEIRQAGGTAIANHADVSNFNAAEGIIQAAIDSFGSIDILVNNAGITRHAVFHEMTEEDFDRVLTVHVKGVFNCSRHACGPMIKQGWGRILNISSGAAIVGSAKRVNYGAAKAGIFGMTNTMCRDLGPLGVTVNALCPGPTDTRMIRFSMQQAIDARERGDLSQVEAESKLFHIKPEPPEDLAPLAVYLCTEAADDVNGQVFHSTGSAFGWYRPLEVNRHIYKAGRWTQDELHEIMPSSLTQGLRNPAPRTKG